MVRRTNAKKTMSRRKYSKKVPLKRMVRSMILKSQETKELTYTYDNVGGTNLKNMSYGSGTAVVGFFGAIAGGTGDGNRIGSRIYARGINIRLAIQPYDYSNYVRIIIFQPKPGMATNIQPSATASFVQSVLSNTPSGVIQWLAPVDTDRFKILSDSNFYLRYQPLDGNSNQTTLQTKFYNKFIKVNRPIQWDDTGVINNDVYMICISDSGSVGTTHPGAVAGFVRVYYKDA